MSDYSIDGMIRYFEMAHKVMGWTSTENSYEYQVAQMLKRLREERDEARREVCKWEAEDYIKEPVEEVAKRRGWDCFKEGTNVESNT
jgi:hypothetical protein